MNTVRFRNILGTWDASVIEIEIPAFINFHSNRESRVGDLRVDKY